MYATGKVQIILFGCNTRNNLFVTLLYIASFCLRLPVALIVVVDKIHDDFHHRILFFGSAFGDHQGQGDQRIVADPFRAVGIVEDAVLFHEPKEQEGGYAFVSIAE